MDCFVVDTGDLAAKVGEKVLLFDGDKASEVARERNTIEYCLMTSQKGRIKRVYLN